MLAIQLLLLVLPIFVSSYRVGIYLPPQENENMTLGELEQMEQQRELKRLTLVPNCCSCSRNNSPNEAVKEREKKELEKREEMKKKVDKMVLEDLKTIANDYKEYSAIGSNKKMTLGKYRAALRDFNKKHPGRDLSFYFERMRSDMKRKLAKKTL